MDNTYFTLLTLNIQPAHFDAAYAAKSEWKKMLIDSTFTLALLTGMLGPRDVWPSHPGGDRHLFGRRSASVVRAS